jgi:hypothetical protein
LAHFHQYGGESLFGKLVSVYQTTWCHNPNCCMILTVVQIYYLHGLHCVFIILVW